MSSSLSVASTPSGSVRIASLYSNFKFELRKRSRVVHPTSNWLSVGAEALCSYLPHISSEVQAYLAPQPLSLFRK